MFDEKEGQDSLSWTCLFKLINLSIDSLYIVKFEPNITLLIKYIHYKCGLIIFWSGFTIIFQMQSQWVGQKNYSNRLMEEQDQHLEEINDIAFRLKQQGR
jgi:hypothetical protein